MLSNSTRIYKKYQDEKSGVEIIAGTESALMIIGCFFTFYRNGNSLHSFGHIEFDDHRGGILDLFPTSLLEDVKVLGLYDVIR